MVEGAVRRARFIWRAATGVPNPALGGGTSRPYRAQEFFYMSISRYATQKETLQALFQNLLELSLRTMRRPLMAVSRH